MKHTISETTLTCPKCGHVIPLNEALTAQLSGQLEQRLQTEYEIRLKSYDPKKCIEQTVKIGDGILLARFDIDESAGEVVAIGIVQNEKPATKVLWKPIRFKLFLL